MAGAVRTPESLLKAVAAADGPAAPVYLVAGEPVLAEPAAERLARALAERAGCDLEIHRRPPSLLPLLDDLRTFSLFASAKVVLVTASAVLADRNAAADLIDDAAEALPVSGGELSPREREAASRLMQALRLFGADPLAGTPEQAIAALPDWAFTGGSAFRKKRNGRGRGKKQAEELGRGLEELLAAARDAGLTGWSAGDLAALSSAIEDGLPEGHTLVLAERDAPDDHPLVSSLARRGLVARVESVESAARGGGWEGLDALAGELEEQTGNPIARDALAELARRTLRKKGDWKDKGAEGDSTARLAAEYRKLAAVAGPGKRIDRALVVSTVTDRGEEDAFKILDAIGDGRGGEALARLERLLAAADEPLGERLRFFALLAGWCRRVAAVHGLMAIHGVRPGETAYPRFQSKSAGRLQRELPGGLPNPVAGDKPYPLHRAYLAAGRLSPRNAASIPAWLLEAELELKGESGDPAAALGHLVARMSAAVAG